MRVRLFAAVFGFAALCAVPALAANGCPEGSYSVVNAPDGTSLSILFSTLSVDSGANPSAQCEVVAPLNLPEGYSLGVYRVDYRGFASLSKQQSAELTVDYHLGPKGNSRHFKRKVQGPQEDDFLFTENIGAGLMKRIGCGEDAKLDVSVALTLAGKGKGDAQASLDSGDAASKGALVYHFDLRKCGK